MSVSENTDEISFRDISYGVKKFFQFLVSIWLAILFALIIGGTIGYIISKLIKPKFTATLTFVLSSESKTGSLSGLATQFGLDIGLNAGNDVFSGENILTLFRSKKMIKEVLFKKPPENNETLINIVARDIELDKKWAKKERTKNLFPFPQNPELLSPIQDSLVREVYTIIIEKLMTVSRPDKKLSVYELSTTSTNQTFACYLTKYLMDETAKFYIETKTSISKHNLQMLQREADSLRGLLGGAISSTASEAERTFNLNPALQAQRAPAQKSQVKATVLATAYGEVIKNLEIAKIALQKETPLYQIIDEPELPLKAKKLSTILFVLIGALAGGLTVIVFIFIKRKW
ncbi:MAG: hypothetical protein M3004_13815 [Bacteroidota bacterium]|nr:hypothetical protein [Bacteroidota bacterium]